MHYLVNKLLDSINHITEELDSKKSSLRIFIDLSEVFDTINHKILIETCNYGVYVAPR